MYKDLYQYLIQYKKLSVPGIGTFLLERHPAVANFPARLIHAPYFGISLNEEAESISNSFYQELASLLGCSERDAVIRFNDFSFSFKNKIKNGDRIDWAGVGVLTKSLSGGVQFTPATPILKEDPVLAEKVMREKATHTVRVGEEERTAEEMTAYFNQPEEKKSYWWVWAAVLALLSFLFLGWHLSVNGIDALGNRQFLKPVPPINNTYSIIE
jgi:hypothetical protein